MNTERIVIKFGTSTLTAGTPRLSPPRLLELVRQIAALHAAGHEIMLVSSGAIAAGREGLNFPSLPKDLPAKQMLAAIGQPRLMALYEQLFGLYGLTVAQVLLTRMDLSNRRRYLNSRNTLNAILGQRVIPIINENDTVATEEIRVGDNDTLSALVANLTEANLLILLTDQEGLFTADPRQDPQATLLTEVSEETIPDSVWQAAGGTSTGLGTGGMMTKIQAADLARRSGTTVVIARGSETEVITRLAAGERLGTRFLPTASTVEGRKRYLLAGRGGTGKLWVDVGAAQALRRGGSLLPAGLVNVEGRFERGDTVRILDPQGQEVARGLANYTSSDLRRIQGLRSDAIESRLGYIYGEEAVHHNNMVLL